MITTYPEGFIANTDVGSLSIRQNIQPTTLTIEGVTMGIREGKFDVWGDGDMTEAVCSFFEFLKQYINMELRKE